MKEVAAIPTAANANPISRAAGTAMIAHHDSTSPNAAMTIMNPIAYRPPRMSDHVISPTAMSTGFIGVARTAS